MLKPDTDVVFVLRALGGLAGVVVGGFLGAVVMVALVIFSGETLGTHSVSSGICVGGGIGLVLGLFWPKALGSAFGHLISGLWR